MRHLLTTLALAPLLLLQGRAVRRDTPLLPEPPGARRGRRGNGAPLRLLVIGDSAAAGVGAGHQDEALLGRLVAALGKNHRVHWELQAETGETTASTLARLPQIEAAGFDLVVTSLGVNDVTANLALRRWRAQQRELRRQLRDRFSPRLLVVSGLPPMRAFPALPQPLRWYLGKRAEDFNRGLAADIAAEADVRMLSLEFDLDTASMAADGFHPGPGIYAEWARQVARLAAERL